MGLISLLLVVVLSGHAKAQTCFEGKPFEPALAGDIEKIKTEKFAALASMQQELNVLKQELLALPAGHKDLLKAKASRLTDLIDLQDTSLKLISTCTADAKQFFECAAYKKSYIEARYALGAKRATLDLATPANQREWQAVAPVLQNDIDTAYDSYFACSGNSP